MKFVTETVSSKLLILTEEGITWRNEVTIAKLLLSVTHHASEVSMEITLCLVLWCDCSLHYGCSSTYILHILFLMSSPGYTFFFSPNWYHFTSVFYKVPWIDLENIFQNVFYVFHLLRRYYEQDIIGILHNHLSNYYFIISP